MTKTSIGRRIGRLWILEKYLVKLPKTNNIVNSLVESHEEYQIRRMKWAARILFEEGVSLTMSKIVKKAGLFRGYSENVSEAISNEIKNIFRKVTKNFISLDL